MSKQTQGREIVAETMQTVKDIKTFMAGYYYRQYKSGEELPAPLLAFVADRVNAAMQMLCDLSQIIDG